MLEKQSGALDHFKGAAIGSLNNVIVASIVSVSESGRGDRGGPVPAAVAAQSYVVEEEKLQDNGSDRPDNTNEIEMNESDGGGRRAEEECEGRISETSGANEDVDEDATDAIAAESYLVEEEELQENGSDRSDENVEHTNEIEMNESDGGGWRAEECEGEISDCSGADEDVDEDATGVDVDPPLISAETIAERAAHVVNALASTTTAETIDEGMLRSGITTTFEELRGREEANREEEARYGIDFQEECLANMCRAADLAGIGQLENQLDESEFDIEEVAQELSKLVDPDNPRSISIGQYCIDQLMIMEVR